MLLGGGARVEKVVSLQTTALSEYKLDEYVFVSDGINYNEMCRAVRRDARRIYAGWQVYKWRGAAASAAADAANVNVIMSGLAYIITRTLQRKTEQGAQRQRASHVDVSRVLNKHNQHK